LLKPNLAAAALRAFIGFDVLGKGYFGLTARTREVIDEDIMVGKLDLDEYGAFTATRRQKAYARIVFAHAPTEPFRLVSTIRTCKYRILAHSRS
jgi:hypothetical protein